MCLFCFNTQRIQKLEDLGFQWYRIIDTPTPEEEAMWQLSFEKLKAFKEENGHFNFPHEEYPLHEWVQSQQKAFRRNKMTQERKELLGSIGFVFEEQTSTPPQPQQQEIVWNTRLELLKVFKQAVGHCNASYCYVAFFCL